MKKFLIVLNPASGNGKGNEVAELISEYFSRAKIQFQIICTKYPGNATEIVLEKGKEFDIIISAGGDGTLNEVINGYSEILNDKIFGIIPIGTGNDFVKNLNLPIKLKDNLKFLTSKKWDTITADVGRFEGVNLDNSSFRRKFINNLGIGFDAYVAFLKSEDKKFNGVLSYIVSVFKALKSFNFLDIKIKTDNSEYSGEKLLCCIGNGISSGGGFYLTPDAKIDDNKLDICLVDKLSKIKILKYLPMALLNKLKGVPVAQFNKINSADISINNTCFVHCDGEIVSNNATYITVKTGLEKIKFVYKEM